MVWRAQCRRTETLTREEIEDFLQALTQSYEENRSLLDNMILCNGDEIVLAQMCEDGTGVVQCVSPLCEEMKMGVHSKKPKPKPKPKPK